MIDNYKDLTLEKYLELYELDVHDMEDIDIQSNIIAILSDMTVDDVIELPISKYKKLASKASFLTVKPNVKAKKIKSLVIDDKVFFVVDKVEDMKTGQYIDYQTYISKGDAKMLPYILSCIVIPKGEKYGDSDTIGYMKRMTVEEALSISNFFMQQSRTLTNATLRYLEWIMKMKMKRTKEETVKTKMEEAMRNIRLLRTSLKNGDGFQP